MSDKLSYVGKDDGTLIKILFEIGYKLLDLKDPLIEEESRTRVLDMTEVYAEFQEKYRGYEISLVAVDRDVENEIANYRFVILGKP